MAKKSRTKARDRRRSPRVRSGRGSRARAGPAAATRPATAPRTALPAYVAPAVRGPAVRVRPGRPARAGARGHRAARPWQDRHRGPRGDALHAAADGRAGDGARRRRGLAGAAGAAPVRRPVPRPGRRARPTRWPSPTRAPGIVGLTEQPGPGPRLQDLVTDEPLDGDRPRRLRVLGRGRPTDDPATAAALEQANTAASRRARLDGVEAAYWTDVGTKEHLRWVMPEPEAELLDALARLHAAGKDRLRRGLPAGRHVPRPRPARPGLGPARRHRRPRPSRSRPSASPPTSPRRWPTTPT